MDETFKQLIGQTREPLPIKPGAVERFDHVYVRHGVTHHIGQWQEQRNAAQTKVDWQFTTDDARIKLRRLYPSVEG